MYAVVAQLCITGELQAVGEHTSDLHALTSLHSSKQQGDFYAESTCCNYIFQVFQVFQRYIASVSYRCCKSRSGCCICCNDYARMFQVYVLNVSSISNVRYKYFHMDVAKVDLNVAYACIFQVFHTSIASISSRCYIIFAMVSSVFQVILQVFQTHVLSVSSVSLICCNCCI
jgi:hypothetical protein